jgi:hypothetical protein
MNTMPESEHLSSNFQAVEDDSNGSQPREPKSVKDDLQDTLNLRAARFSTALLQEELDEKVLIKGLQFELVRINLVFICPKHF